MTHYTPVIWGEMNDRLGEVKFNSLKILLYYGARSYIILGKHTKKLQNKQYQAGPPEIKIILPELCVTKIVTWNFHADVLQ